MAPSSFLRVGLLSSTALTLVAGLVVACSTETSDPSADAPSATGTPSQPVATSPGATQVTQPATTEAACEDFGALSGSALAAVVKGTSAGTSMAVANRPVVTKLAVTAYGSAATLVGQTAVLGAGANGNLATCTHCLAVAVGCTSAGCANAAWFVPRSGTATFTKVGYTAGAAFEGTFSNVVLERVDIDPATMTSTPAPGGACIRVPSLAFSATVSGAGTRLLPDGGVSTGATSPDGGSTSSGSGGGSGQPKLPSGSTDAGTSDGGLLKDGGSKAGGGGGGGGLELSLSDLL